MEQLLVRVLHLKIIPLAVLDGGHMLSHSQTAAPAWTNSSALTPPRKQMNQTQRCRQNISSKLILTSFVIWGFKIKVGQLQW